MMLPERFDLHYIDEHGQPQRPIAIHRAIYGSLERFIGILMEHFAGAFPLWLAPVQAVVIPIADRHVEAAEELAAVLRAQRPAGRGGRLRQPDAEQDPARPGAEGAVHARPRRPRGRGPHRRRPPRGAEKGDAQETLGWDVLADRFAAESRPRARVIALAALGLELLQTVDDGFCRVREPEATPRLRLVDEHLHLDAAGPRPEIDLVLGLVQSAPTASTPAAVTGNSSAGCRFEIEGQERLRPRDRDLDVLRHRTGSAPEAVAAGPAIGSLRVEAGLPGQCSAAATSAGCRRPDPTGRRRAS